MSQEKVNRYKAEKANRKEILKKEKRKRTLIKILMIFIAIAIIGWIGYSIYDYAMRADAKISTEINLTPVNEYLQGLNPPIEDADNANGDDIQDGGEDGEKQADQPVNDTDGNDGDNPAGENKETDDTSGENNN